MFGCRFAPIGVDTIVFELHDEHMDTVRGFDGPVHIITRPSYFEVFINSESVYKNYISAVFGFDGFELDGVVGLTFNRKDFYEVHKSVMNAFPETKFINMEEHERESQVFKNY